MTWPGALNLDQRLIGNNIDNWIYYWNDWWLRQAITSGQDWFYTDYLFYPPGTSLLTHAHSFLNSLLAFLLTPLVGSVAAFNLVILFGLWAGLWVCFCWSGTSPNNPWRRWERDLSSALPLII
jgi:hypothetical protein